MTGPRRLTHAIAEELISASLTGDLSGSEAADLTAHLAACERCTATAAAWADSRRLLSGIRHVPAPRDLGARVRTGIEGGRIVNTPWYRRPIFAVASVGALAAAALVLAVIVSLPDATPPVASTSPQPSGSATPPSATATGEATSTAKPSATVEPPPATLPPDYRIEYAFDVPGDITQGSTVTLIDQATGDVVRTLVPGQDIDGGQPIQAALSPDGTWLALRILQDAVPREMVYAVELNGDAVIELGASMLDTFAERLLWSPDGRFLVTTLVAEGSGEANVTGFDTRTGEVVRLTGRGDAYAASWESDTILWMSFAGPEPTSNRFDLSGGLGNEGELGTTAPPVPGVFLPMLSPNGETVIFWRGPMEQSGAGWTFTNGGVLNLAASAYLDGETQDAAPLFVEAPGPIAVARVAWAADSDAYAVWSLGYVASEGDPRSVYFGHLSLEDGRISQRQRLDDSDVPDGATVIDVAPAPDGRHLALTVVYPIPGDLAQPVAELLLVTRNFGDEADVVQRLGPTAIWVGPGIYE